MHRPGRRIDFSTGQRNIIRIIHANESSARGPGFEPFSTRSWLTLVSRPLPGPLFSRFHFYPLIPEMTGASRRRGMKKNSTINKLEISFDPQSRVPVYRIR